MSIAWWIQLSGVFILNCYKKPLLHGLVPHRLLKQELWPFSMQLMLGLTEECGLTTGIIEEIQKNLWTFILELIEDIWSPFSNGW